MVEFRRSLTASFLFRFFVESALELEADAPGCFKALEGLPAGAESAARAFERPASKGMQFFTKVADGQVVGQPERHMAADLQVQNDAVCSKSYICGVASRAQLSRSCCWCRSFCEPHA